MFAQDNVSKALENMEERKESLLRRLMFTWMKNSALL